MAYQGNLRPHDAMRALTLKHTVVELCRKINVTLQSFRIPFSERRNLLSLVDILLVLAAVWVTHQFGHVWLPKPLVGNALYENWYWFLSMAACWWALAYFNDLYHIPSAGGGVMTTLRMLLVGIFSAVVFFLLDQFFPQAFPLRFSLYVLFLTLTAVLTWRFVYIQWFRAISTAQRVLIVGPGQRDPFMAHVLSQLSAQDYQVVGYVNDEQAMVPALPAKSPAGIDQPLQDLHALPNLGSTPELLHLIQHWSVDEVLVAIQGELSQELFQVLVACQGQGVQVTWMADIYERLAHCIPVNYVSPTWALCAMQGQAIFRRLPMIGKRLLDLTMVCCSLPVFGLLVPLLALAIRLDSEGPVFYRQIRSGRGGKPFSILKFRTMVVNAERVGEARWATKNDPRITRVGHFLRKTRLDELPQIFNILKGEMSIVGPRPERPQFIAELQAVIPFYDVRLTVKPGLTGWAQIHYDYGNTIEDAVTKLQYDFYYIRYWSLWLDLYTMFKTVFVVLRYKGL
jgi:exopolysaccharide biosynthesis polyprenyl glycosylphosphotransferase